ncbi:hypothetical protein GZL_00153 [Streptomyces sp. 769]|nr:hypothetical protein GZL_00153 [Streptomyces sp. 769]
MAPCPCCLLRHGAGLFVEEFLFAQLDLERVAFRVRHHHRPQVAGFVVEKFGAEGNEPSYLVGERAA